jgi:hypothetical protein
MLNTCARQGDLMRVIRILEEVLGEVPASAPLDAASSQALVVYTPRPLYSPPLLRLGEVARQMMDRLEELGRARAEADRPSTAGRAAPEEAQPLASTETSDA